MQNYSSKFKILLRVLFICLIFSFSLLIFNLDKAEASALSLSLDPPIIDINALPPTNITSNLTIQNKGDDQVKLKIQIKPFKAAGEDGELEFLDSRDYFIENNAQILDSGISVEDITLGPRQKKDLTLNINIPQDTNISDHYFSILFVSENSLSPTSTTSLNQLGIASNVLLSVGSREDPDATLDEFSTRLFYEGGPVSFTIRVKNMGDHFIKPKGEILIANMFGQNIGKLDIVSTNVLSDSSRTIPNPIWKEDFLLGFYTAKLNMVFSSDGPLLSRSIYFLAFPFQGLIILVISLMALTIIRNKVRSRLGQK